MKDQQSISPEAGEKFCELLDIIARLRAPGGCPWDQKQTVRSFKSYLLEESHELSEALDGSDPSQVKEELGDLFFQLGFINQLYNEQDHFSMKDVLQSIIDKMIRRHPHVFEGKTFASEAERKRDWAKIKARENKRKKKKTDEFAVPKSLPALTRSQRIASRVARTGFDWPDMETMMAKLSGEFQELSDTIASDDTRAIERQLGDLMFMLVNVARKFNINSEACLHDSTERFITCFTRMQKMIQDDDGDIVDLEPAALLTYWQQSKEKS